MTNFRTPKRQVRGLGSAKSGVHHFITQRVSALALIILVPLFCWGLAAHHVSDYDSARAWFGSTTGAIVTLVALTAAFYHMRLGLQTVIEDYIEKAGTKMTLLVLNTLLAAGLWLATLYSVLKLAA